MSKISGLTTIFATDVTWYDLSHKWSFCQWWRCHFKWSSWSRVPIFIMVFIMSEKWRMKCKITRFQESVAFDWYRKSFSLTRRLKMDIQERTSVSCTGVNCQHVKLYGFNTVWESLIWFHQGISSHAKIGAGTIMQEATPNGANLSSKWVPLQWVLILIRRICGLFHKFSRSINLFSTTFCLSFNCF